MSLSEEEKKPGCILGLGSWSATGCSGKHAYVDDFVEGWSFIVPVFTSTLDSIDNLPHDNILYAFDEEDGTVVFLKHNNTI